MPARASILVVAKDPEVRRSLGFMLEAEGYRVDCRSTAPTAAEAAGFSGIVADGHDWPRDNAPPGPPVVLLVSTAGARELPGNAREVVKPLLGSQLVDVLRHMLGYGAASTGFPVGG